QLSLFPLSFCDSLFPESHDGVLPTSFLHAVSKKGCEFCPTVDSTHRHNSLVLRERLDVALSLLPATSCLSDMQERGQTKHKRAYKVLQSVFHVECTYTSGTHNIL